MGSFAADLRFALRTLRTSPAFAATAFAVLALGIGANTAVFTVVDAVLLRPLPYPEAGRLVMVWEEAPKWGFPQNTPAPANYLDWTRQNTVFEEMAALRNSALALTGAGGDPEIVRASRTTPSLFRVLRVPALHGRVLADSDDRADAAKVAVLGHALWVRRFAADPAIVGREIVLNDEKYTVAGVMPKGFAFPRPEVQLYVPTAFTPAEWEKRSSHFLNVVARLKPGATLAGAQNEMRAIADRLQRDYPDTNMGIGAVVVSLRDQYTRQVRTGLWALLAAVCFVLLIACANIANLLLARATSRSREIAVRAAIGADRRRIAQQLLTESLVLAMGGALLGATVASVALRGLEALVPPDMAGNLALSLDWRVLAFTAVVAVASAVLFGIAPAWSAGKVDLHEALKQGGRGIAGRRSRLRDALVAGEVALAMILLSGAGLMIQTLSGLRSVDLGFQPEGVMTFGTPLFSTRYREDSDRVGFMNRVLERVRTLPGVTDAAFTSDLPLVMKGNTRGFSRAGYPPPAPGDTTDANYREITPDYLRAMRIPLLRGRYLQPGDILGAKPVAVINEQTARQFWPDRDPLGQKFKFGLPDSPQPWIEVVGVAGNIHQMGIEAPPRAEIYVPLAQVQAPDPNYLVLRTPGDPAALVSAVLAEIHAVDPQQPVARVQSMGTVVDKELQQRETQMLLLAGFAGLAVLLASIGVYGVLSFAVVQRTPEIGVRMALGARAGEVLRMVAAGGLRLAAIGVAIGTIGALALTRLLASLLFGVRPHDPVTFAAGAALLLAVSAAAALIPAVRASRLDPLTALRVE